MILSRVIKHVQAQDWTAIVIDFVIVVLGVVIGIQVANWNAARQLEESDFTLKLRMLTDFQLMRVELAAKVEHGTSIIENTQRVLEVLRAGRAPDDTPEWRQSLCRASFLFNVPRPPASFEQFRSSGAISRLSNLPLEKALADYGQAATAFAAMYPVVLAANMQTSGNFFRAVHFNPVGEKWSYDDPACVLGFDAVRLVQSTGELQILIGGQSDLVARARKQLTDVETIISLLANEVE